MLRLRWAVGIMTVLLAGAFLKGIAAPAGRADLAPAAGVGRLVWPWSPGAVVTVYFPEPQSGHLIPVERAVRRATPETALAELFAGPAPGRLLAAAVPAGVRVRSVRFDQGGESGVHPTRGRAVLEVEGGVLTETALRAIALTLGADEVEVVGGQALQVASSGTRLYYMHRGMPLPILYEGAYLEPPGALEALLEAPAPAGVAWLPAGITVDGFSVKGRTASVRLRFAPELQALVESGLWSFAPYYMGVVYTLTEYPAIDQVRFEFAGLSPLALKQCRTPLAVSLKRPGPESGRAREGS